MTSQDPVDLQVAEVLARRGRECDEHLRAMLDALPSTPARLRESIAYSLFAGGKRVRPTLVLEWHEAISGKSSPDNSAIHAAAAIELIHTFSLIHDDLPAMDDDDLRRGKPTNHKVFGEALAILAGDAMTTLAFEQLSYAEPRHVCGLVRELGFASGAQGMVGGQVMDLENENVSLPMRELQKLHAMKTGALLTCACRLGAIAADATREQLDAATAYGRHLGLAFQIMDDVLDETSTPEEMGKATGKDGHAGKNTYPRLLGCEGSIALAREEVQRALDAIAPLGEAGATLAAIARFVVERKS
jgi:geranylgeranyl diphosphate synthase type II